MPQDDSVAPTPHDSPKPPLDYAAILEQLTHATLFDLHRLQAALSRMLDDPERIAQAKQKLRVGDEIEYFTAHENRMIKARLLRCNRTRAVVRHLEDGATWQVPYGAINTEGVSTKIPQSPSKGLRRIEVSVGDRVGFVDRDRKEHYGTIAKLNPKTVTVMCDGEDTRWRVGYGLLFRVVDGGTTESASPSPHVVEALSFRPTSAPK